MIPRVYLPMLLLAVAPIFASVRPTIGSAGFQPASCRAPRLVVTLSKNQVFPSEARNLSSATVSHVPPATPTKKLLSRPEWPVTFSAARFLRDGPRSGGTCFSPLPTPGNTILPNGALSSTPNSPLPPFSSVPSVVKSAPQSASQTSRLATQPESRPANDDSPLSCRSLRKHGHRSEAQSCFEALTRSSNPYDRAEGFWGLQEWQQANEQFRLATQSPDANPLYKVRWGLLLHERFNDNDAAGLFREALQKDPSNAQAYIGLAIISADAFDGHATEYLAKAIALDPKLASPHELMADLALTNDDRELAASEADKAIALENDALDAMATHAAIELLADRAPDEWFAKISAINPHYGEAYSHVARQLELHYRYEDTVTYYRKAIALDSELWSAHSALGIDLMRLGRQDEAFKELQLSYDNRYRDAATVNSLRLLDSYKNFQTFRDSSTILILNKSEAALLLPYMQSELHTIIATYQAKYHMQLPGPVQVEVYPNHDDFAVRTTGMPGLGALGVTFGEVVAMDSPSARKPGDFNWGSTLWHEMSHVFILTATNHRVPRWFTEGLAVHEEGQRSPEWADRLTPEVVIAIRDKKLLPVSKLDRGFTYPQYPSQVVVSYFQAGSICDFIKGQWGEAKLLDMAHSFAKLQTTPQVVQQDLGLAPADFDKQYLVWIDKKYGAQASHFDEWREKLKALNIAAQQKQFDVVLQQGPAVLALYPEYVDDANVYELMADAYKARGDSKSEAAILAAYAHAGGRMPGVLQRLAALQQSAGQLAAAAATLERVNYIYPVKNDDLHRQLGDLLYAQKNYDGAIREYTALVASNPVDKAGAQFHLAQAYFAAGQRDKAEDSVLSSLEAAPGYRPAQQLLLQLQQSPAKSN
jgi:cellulose synthase operon protein C